MEKIFFKVALILILISSAEAVHASVETNFKKLIKKHRFTESTLGLYVEDEGKKVVDINAGKAMVPASLTKIVTGGAILSKISLNKKFTTELLSAAEIEGLKLKGNLCLKGGGDPSFVSEKMWYLVNELTRTGVKKIEGDLIIDSSRFDNIYFDSARDSKRVDRAYDAPISAVSFNWNSVNVFIRPGVKPGESVRVTLDPVNDYLELENKAKTVVGNNIKTIEVARVKSGQKEKIIVTGNLSADADEMVVYKSIANPALWTASNLKEFLRQREISFNGNIVESECELGSKMLASVSSKNLLEMNNDMLKFSNNFVSEMLVKNLAAEEQASKGIVKNATMKEGIESIKVYLDNLGFSRKDYVLENAAGFTRDNRFTAKQLSVVLKHIKKDFLVYPEFLAGLPIAGVDGTLKNRFKKDGVIFLRAKTGYLDGIIGLAGYVGRVDKAPLIFVFMFNGEYEQGLAARALFDDFIRELLKN